MVERCGRVDYPDAANGIVETQILSVKVRIFVDRANNK